MIKCGIALLMAKFSREANVQFNFNFYASLLYRKRISGCMAVKNLRETGFSWLLEIEMKIDGSDGRNM